MSQSKDLLLLEQKHFNLRLTSPTINYLRRKQSAKKNKPKQRLSMLSMEIQLFHEQSKLELKFKVSINTNYKPKR
jgi:hypothetical protein